MEIRLATEKDLTEIFELYKIFFSETAELESYYFQPAEQQYFFVKGIMQSESGDILVAIEENKLQGFVLVQQMQTLPYSCIVPHWYAELTDIVVSPEVRSKGIGKKLIQAVKEWAKIRKLDYIELNVLSKNTRAIKLYEKEGFSSFLHTMKMKLTDK